MTTNSCSALLLSVSCRVAKSLHLDQKQPRTLTQTQTQMLTQSRLKAASKLRQEAVTNKKAQESNMLQQVWLPTSAAIPHYHMLGLMWGVFES